MRNMVFRVMPKLVYDATRDYNKEKRAYDQMIVEQNLNDKTNDPKKDHKKMEKM